MTATDHVVEPLKKLLARPGVSIHGSSIGSASLYVLRIAKAELGASIAHDEENEFGLWTRSGCAQRCISGEPVVRIGGRSRGAVMPRVRRSVSIAS